MVLYLAVNFAGMYTKYLTDRGQRKAFLETHRSMETRYHTQKENDRQEKLLLSGKLYYNSRFVYVVYTYVCVLNRSVYVFSV